MLDGDAAGESETGHGRQQRKAEDGVGGGHEDIAGMRERSLTLHHSRFSPSSCQSAGGDALREVAGSRGGLFFPQRFEEDAENFREGGDGRGVSRGESATACMAPQGQ